MLDAMILDYYHFRDHAIACSKVLYGEGTTEAKRWRKALSQTVLRSGPFETLLAKSRNALKSSQTQIPAK